MQSSIRYVLILFSAGLFVILALHPIATAARPALDRSLARNAATAAPENCRGSHSVGKLCCIVDTYGGFSWWDWYGSYTDHSCWLGERHPDKGGYPKGSRVEYTLAGSIWVGTRTEDGDFVSVTWDGDSRNGEFYPDPLPFGKIDYRSITSSSPSEREGAVSEEDYIAVFRDTFTVGPQGLVPDYFNQRPHKPLGLEITQKSHAWSYVYADDFILFNLGLKNIGDQDLNFVYVGILINAHAGYIPHGTKSASSSASSGDLCGYLPSFPSWRDCGALDTINLAWHADADGDPVNGRFTDLPDPYRSCTGVAGIRFLTPFDETVRISYNWWVNNVLGDLLHEFGPRARPAPGEALFNFHTGGSGMPRGDRNKYHVLSNGEIDYDQAYTATIGPNDPHWLDPPRDIAQEVTEGLEVMYLLSVGPFFIPKGATMPLAFAYVAGENFHRNPNNLRNLEYREIDRYYENLDFSEIARNAVWAGWVYDNPGVDTDGDGYFGEYRVCATDSQFIDGSWVITAADTNWYKGDGVPDWRAAGPPPAPKFWLTPTLNGIHVRFNGYLSETTKDIFSNIIDFEGYRVYFGRDERESSLSLVASYDRENFDKYVYNPRIGHSGEFQIQSIPMTLEEIRCLYGEGDDPCDDMDFNPLRFNAQYPYIMPNHYDSIFYFRKHDHNASVLGISTPIKRIYPNQPKPETADTLNPDAVTDDGYLKYYEYECTIDGLLPTVPYYVNVTAFDFGSPESGLTALETSKVNGLQYTWPKATGDQLSGTLPPVYVYPNPYRLNAHYRREGFEGRGREHLPDFRTREIHFENLPPKCWISIFTLDGDLVRKIRHDTDPTDPNSTHDSWNFITRNAQLPVTGIYYWTVEDDTGPTQMGKLVIIL